MKKYYYILGSVLLVEIVLIALWYMRNPALQEVTVTASNIPQILNTVWSTEHDLVREGYSPEYATFGDARQAVYTEQIAAVRAELANASSLDGDEYAQLARAAINTLINANIDFKTEEARSNYIEAFRIGYNAFADTRLSLRQKEAMVASLHDALFNSCWKYNWFIAAAKEFDNGAFMNDVAAVYSVAEGDHWREMRFLGIDGMLIPFEPALAARDATWHNEQLLVHAIFKKMIGTLGVEGYAYTLPVAVLNTSITLHELDNPRLTTAEENILHKQLALQANALDVAYKSSQATESHRVLRIRAWYLTLATTLHATIPDLYATLPTVDADFAELIAIAEKISKELGSNSAEYFIRSYYAALKAGQNASTEELSTILYFLNDPAEVEKGIGYTLFIRSGHYLPNDPPVEDAVRPFLYQFALGNDIARNTLAQFGWKFSATSAE